MRVGNDHHTRGDGTGSHDYRKTIEVEYCESSKDLFALAFSGVRQVECVFSRCFVEWVSGR